PRADAGGPHPARQGDALARALRHRDRAAVPVMAGPRLVGVATAVVLGLCLAVLGFAGTGEDAIRAVIRLTARTSLALFLLAFCASPLFRLPPRPPPPRLLPNPP